jgi:hypothetical protein
MRPSDDERADPSYRTERFTLEQRFEDREQDKKVKRERV